MKKYYYIYEQIYIKYYLKGLSFVSNSYFESCLVKKITEICLARPTEKVWIAAPVLHLTEVPFMEAAKGVFLSKPARISV